MGDLLRNPNWLIWEFTWGNILFLVVVITYKFVNCQHFDVFKDNPEINMTESKTKNKTKREELH